VSFAVYLVFEDGTRELRDEFSDLGDAAGFAIEVADAISQQPPSDERGRPAKIDVRQAGRLEISIRVMRGGLLGNRDAPKLRSI
jgi:hypothetical protein